MQVQNGSRPGYGYSARLSDNVTWSYPFAPGEPSNVLFYEFAACVPSNLTIANTCCSAAKGTFVENSINRRDFNQSEIDSIFGGNSSNTAHWKTGTLINATGAGEVGDMHWCSLSYDPMSSQALQASIGYSSGGQELGNTPESVAKWIECFNANVPQGAVNRSEAAYVCMVRNGKTGGGTIEGFNHYIANTNGAQATTRKAVVWGLLGTTVLASLLSL